MANELAVNTRERVQALTQEVLAEFKTSSDEVYKESLRSLIEQQNKLLKQVDDIRKDIEEVEECKKALEAAFVSGALLSMDDALKTVKRASAAYKAKQS